jgi:hypothetical protein
VQRWLPALTAALVVSAPLSISAAENLSRPLTIRAVLPQAALASAQVAAMTSEVQAIWAPLGVQVIWRSSLASDESTVDWTIAVHVQDRLPINTEGLASQPLGAVLREQGRLQPVIFVSRFAVQQLLKTARVWKNETRFDRVYGRFVGRIVAHELGHLLLDSTTHRKKGLMRRDFGSRDVLIEQPIGYAFDDQDRATLGRRVAILAPVAVASAPIRVGSSLQ